MNEVLITPLQAYVLDDAQLHIVYQHDIVETQASGLFEKGPGQFKDMP